jgi:SPP1 gp7 family putative phage head morphogenesis protein
MFDWFKTKSVDEPNVFTSEEIEFYILLVYHGIVTKTLLNSEYHAKIAAYFEKALFEGYGGDLFSFGIESKLFSNITQLRRSLYVFSAAKQYSQVREMSSLINVKGEKAEFKVFKEKAGEVFDAYNKNYLKTEFNTAVGQSQMAREYTDYIVNQTPLIQYRTQRDKRVRDEHAILDGITLPPEDPFWRYNMPKNGWNCRCFTVPVYKGKETDLTQRDLSDLEDEKKFPKLFRMNPGIDGYIFDPNQHPYFSVAKGDAGFKKANYNLFVP